MPRRKRKRISDRKKLAATLLHMRAGAADGYELLIPYEDGKQMSADQIISLFHYDHYPIPHAEGGPDEPWNLTPRLIADHREKTRKVDLKQIAKNKRIQKRKHEHAMRITEFGNSGMMVTHTMTLAEARKQWPDILLPDPGAVKHMPREIYIGAGKRIRSRGFDKTKTRGFDGKVRKRGKR